MRGTAHSPERAEQHCSEARANLGAAGVNLLNAYGAAAWQTVFHFHSHVIPRYEDDPLKLPWVPGEGDMDVIKAAGEELRQ